MRRLTLGTSLTILVLLTSCGPAPTPVPTPTPTEPPPTLVRPLATPTLPPAPTATPAPGTPTPLPVAQAGTRLREVQDRGYIVVGVDVDAPLLGYLNPNTGGLEGFQIELAKELAVRVFTKDTQVEVWQAPASQWASLLQEGKLDLIISRVPLEQAGPEMAVSEPYLESNPAMLIPKDSPIGSIADLAGKSVGTVTGWPGAASLKAEQPQVALQEFEGYKEAIAALEGGQVAAIVSDEIVLQGFAAQTPEQWRVVKTALPPVLYGIGISARYPELVSAVNLVLRDLKASGGWQTLYERAIQSPAPEPP